MTPFVRHKIAKWCSCYSSYMHCFVHLTTFDSAELIKWTVNLSVFCQMHNWNFIVIISLLWIIKWFVPPLIKISAYFYYATSGPVSWRTFIDTLEVCLYYHPQPLIFFFQVCFHSLVVTSNGVFFWGFQYNRVRVYRGMIYLLIACHQGLETSCSPILQLWSPQHREF